ncbi:MAG: peptidase S41 [Bacteroidetes bacterium]|nr:MAG: peptidase S41 [Bacteroidota bacterium]
MKNNVIYILVLLLLAGCEGNFFDLNYQSVKPKDNFEYLWNECNEKYAYFELKKINWDSIREEYQQYLYMEMTDDSLFSVLGGMLSELKDDHTNLISNFNISRFGVRYLGQDNFDWRIIEDHYIGHDYFISGPFKHQFLSHHNIGYIRFAEFPGSINDQNIDYVLSKYRHTDGLILDLRENGGGAVTDIFNLLGRFIDKKTLIYYSRIKNGIAHDAFSAPQPVYIYPKGKKQYLKKVIMLTDRGTYSAGSVTALSTKAMPNITLMGDTTGGGLGLPNGGQLPNGWRYRFSVTQALTLDLSPDYEQGVPPDRTVLFDWNNLEKDEILDAAIQEIVNH